MEVPQGHQHKAVKEKARERLGEQQGQKESGDALRSCLFTTPLESPERPAVTWVRQSKYTGPLQNILSGIRRQKLSMEIGVQVKPLKYKT